jgi:peptidoglycan/LPS O-acetylase OafA/YrhL
MKPTDLQAAAAATVPVSVPSDIRDERTATLSHLKYRPDIDGLRAVAVLSVVGFHAFPAWIPGGFVGVDIFFVISGFLISSIIFDNLQSGRFSFGEFYARRVLRIFPALLVVLVACFMFGWIALLAGEYQQLGKHIAAATAFISNFIFWGESGYFDNAAETKPLLHLWSLGIEEQFYILWPLLLWTGSKRQIGFALILIAGIALSFALNIYDTARDSSAAFYSPQTRFWELMAGGALARFMKVRQEAVRKLPPHLWNVLASGGLLLIVFSVMQINSKFAFPGWWSLLPVLGALLMIAAGTSGLPNRLFLSAPPMVWFGLISYPLYLWHWPLLSFSWIIESQTPSRGVRVLAVALAILLAWGTYQYIERPIRFGGRRRGRVVVLLFAMLVMGALGFVTFWNGGMNFRPGAEFQSAIDGDVGNTEFLGYLSKHFQECSLPRTDAASQGREEFSCFNSHGGAVDIALVGDSHAQHLFLGLAEALPNKNVAFYPINGLPFVHDPRFQVIYDRLKAQSGTEAVILANNWHGRKGEIPAGSSLKAELAKIIDRLDYLGKRVYLMEAVPSFSFAPQKCKGLRWPSTERRCSEDLSHFDIQKRLFKSDLQSLETTSKVRVISTSSFFCSDTECSMLNGKRLLYRDNNHLNIPGSRHLGRSVVEGEPDLANY